MKKRILSLVLVLCMVLSLMPGMSISASAATEQATGTHDCTNGSSFDTKFEYTSGSVPKGKSYYLTGNITATGDITIGGSGETGKVNLCLNGYTLDMQGYALKVANVALDVYDHTGTGKITGSAAYGEKTGTVMVSGTYLSLSGGNIEAITGNAICADTGTEDSTQIVKIYVSSGNISGGTAGYGISMLPKYGSSYIRINKNGCTSAITGGLAGIYTTKVIQDCGYAGASAIQVAMPPSSIKRPVVEKAADGGTYPDVKLSNYQLVSPERTLIVEGDGLWDPGPTCTCEVTATTMHTPYGFEDMTISAKKLPYTLEYDLKDTVAIGGSCPYSGHPSEKGTWSYENRESNILKKADLSTSDDQQKIIISFPEPGEYKINCTYTVNGKNALTYAVFTVKTACNCTLSKPALNAVYKTEYQSGIPIEIPASSDSISLNLSTVFDAGVLTNAGTCLIDGHKDGTVTTTYSLVNLFGDPTTIDGVTISGSTLTVTADAAGKNGYVQIQSSANDLLATMNKMSFSVTKETAHTHNDIAFSQWKQGDSLPTASGNYYLTKDVTLTEQATIATGADVKLCLNGHTITAPENGRAFNVQGTLSLYDDTGKAGKVLGASGSTVSENGGVYVAGGGIFNMLGGTITGCKSSGQGGGVYVAANGTFNLSGGTISGNSAANGGGGVYNAGTLTLGGAAVIKNNTKESAASNLEGTGTTTITALLTCADGSIGLSGAESTGLITAGVGVTLSDQRAKFFSDTDGKEIATVDDALQIVTCTCEVSNPAIAAAYASGVAIKIPYYATTGATFALSQLIGTQGEISDGCLVDGHSTAEVSYDYAVTGTGASISGGVLTVTQVGSATVTVKSKVNGKESKGIAVTFNVTRSAAPPPHANHDRSVDCGTDDVVNFDTQWNSATTGTQTIGAGQNIVLMEDVALDKLTITSTSYESPKINLCLNGHTLTVTNGIDIGSYANVSICDCSSDHLTGKINSEIRLNDSYCDLYIYGGTFGTISSQVHEVISVLGGKITGDIIAGKDSGAAHTIYVSNNAVVEGKIEVKGGNKVYIYGNATVGDIETTLTGNDTPGLQVYSIIYIYGTPTIKSITLDDVGTADAQKERIVATYDKKSYTGSGSIPVNCKTSWGTGYVVSGVTDANYMKFVPDPASGQAFSRSGDKLYAGTGCAVSYDRNGASGTTPTGGTYVQGGKVTLPGVGDMTKENCAFKGWSTGEFGAILADEDANTAGVQWTVPIDKTEITLYAIWASSVVSSGELTALTETTLDGVLGKYNYTIDSTTTPAVITLQSDIQLSKTLVFAGVDCVFDLNGHAITQAAAATYGGICLGGYQTATPTKVTIKDSSEEKIGSVTGICSNGNAAVNILAKTVGDSFVIEGGTFTGVRCAGIGSQSPNATVYLTITGGTFVGDTDEYGACFDMGGVNLTVTGGTFTGNGTAKAAYLGDSNADTATYALSGGSFTTGIKSDDPLSTLLAPGYSFWQGSSTVSDLTGKELSGSITVAPSPQAKYTNAGGTEVMGSFLDAVANAQNSSTITIIGDVELSEFVTINKSLTIVAEGDRTIKQTAAGSSSYGLLYMGGNTLTLGKEAGMGSGNTLTIDGQGYSGSALIEGKTTLYNGVTLQNSGGYGIYINSGTVHINGGEIKNCKGNSIFLNTYGVANMSGGKISGGKSSAVFLNSDNAKFTMTGGEICGNSGSYAIDFNGASTAVLSGGKIHGNSSTWYGAVEADGSGIIQLSGNIQIYDNYRGGTLNDGTGLYQGSTQSNIYFKRGYGVTTQPYVTLTGKLGESAKIGFSGDTEDIAVGAEIAKSDGAYTVTDSDMAKFTWDMTGTSNRKLALDTTNNVIKLAAALSAPTISAQPVASPSVTYGAISGSLSVAANLAADSSSATLSYKWQQKGTGDTWGDISDATTASFTIPTTLGAGTYTYRCVVTATLGSDTQSTTSSSAVVTVSAKAITGTASITGTATYGQTLTAGYTKGDENETVGYAWYRSGVGCCLQHGLDLRVGVHIFGCRQPRLHAVAVNIHGHRHNA